MDEGWREREREREQLKKKVIVLSFQCSTPEEQSSDGGWVIPLS